MGRSVAAELLKLLKRRAIWGLGAILVLTVVMFGYALIYFVVVNRPSGVEVTGSAQALRESLLPDSFLSYVLSYLPRLGGAIALILGALAAGGEYGWGTLKTILTQGPGRLQVFGGKLLATGIVLFVFAMLTFAAGAASSIVVAGLEDASVRWPSLQELAQGVGAAWLVLATWAALGVVLAVLFRGTALAIGLGLVYVLVVENVVEQIAPLSDALEALRDVLPGINAGRLVASVGGGSSESAVLVLAAYALVFLLLAALLIRQRDVV